MNHTYYDMFFVGIASLLIFLVGTNAYPIFLGQGSLSVRLGLLTLLPMLGIIILYLGPFLRAVTAVPELSILITLALVSAVWSYAPSNTVERAIPLMITSGFAITLAGVLSLRSLILLFAIVAALSMFGSQFAIFTMPGARGIPPWENTWNGVFNHKNALGEASVLAMVFTASAVSITTGRVKYFFIATLLMAAFLMIASESRSSQLVVFLATGAFFARLAMKRLTLVWAVFFLMFLGSLIGTVYFLMSTGTLDPVFEAVERKPTLSGRIPLWSLVLPYIGEEFWIGYGYRGFWDQSSNRVIKITNDLGLGFTPFYSHSGLIETWLHLGIVGVLLIVAAIIRAFRASFAAMLQLKDQKLVVAGFLVIIAYLLSNITEGSILSRTSLSWMSFVAISTKLCLVARSLKVQPKSRSSQFGGITHRHVSRTGANG